MIQLPKNNTLRIDYITQNEKFELTVHCSSEKIVLEISSSTKMSAIRQICVFFISSFWIGEIRQWPIFVVSKYEYYYLSPNMGFKEKSINQNAQQITGCGTHQNINQKMYSLRDHATRSKFDFVAQIYISLRQLEICLLQ